MIEDDVQRTIDVLAYYGSYGRAHAPASAAQTPGRIGIIVDEWGTWYSQASVEHRLEQRSTLLDAVVAAGTLDLFNRRSDWVVMANIAQTVNVLQAVVQTEGERLWVTPTYHAFRLFAGHMGAGRVRDELETPALTAAGMGGAPTALPVVSGSASVSDGGATLTLTLTNRHLTNAVEVRVDIQGRFAARSGQIQVLGGDDVRAYNTADEPDRVTPTTRDLQVSSGDAYCRAATALGVGGDSQAIARRVGQCPCRPERSVKQSKSRT